MMMKIVLGKPPRDAWQLGSKTLPGATPGRWKQQPLAVLLNINQQECSSLLAYIEKCRR